MYLFAILFGDTRRDRITWAPPSFHSHWFWYHVTGINWKYFGGITCTHSAGTHTAQAHTQMVEMLLAVIHCCQISKVTKEMREKEGRSFTWLWLRPRHTVTPDHSPGGVCVCVSFLLTEPHSVSQPFRTLVCVRVSSLDLHSTHCCTVHSTYHRQQFSY